MKCSKCGQRAMTAKQIDALAIRILHSLDHGFKRFFWRGKPQKWPMEILKKELEKYDG